MAQTHAAQHVGCLGELDVIVANDLYAVAPRIEKIEKRPWQGLNARIGQRFTDRILIIDHKAKMATSVGRLGPALLQCEKLVAKIDEGRSAALAPKFEIEQSTVEGQSLFNVTDLKRYVIETNSSRFCRQLGLLRLCP